MLAFLLLAAGIVTTGYFYYRNHERHHRAEVERQLSAVADLKVGELVQWRKERLENGDVFFKNPSFAALVRRLFEKPADEDAQRQLLDWLGKYPTHYDYDQIRLMDAQGVSRMTVPAGRPPVSSVVSRRIPEVLRSGQVTLLDFYRNEHDQRINLAVMVPILDEQGGNQPLGVLVLRVDPGTYLYPFIKRWPTPSLTAETLLVRREGNETVFLNELRFQTNTAMNLRVPLDSTTMPAVQAALGRDGIMEGIDYRGVSVVAALRTVPDSPWALVTRMDTAEVYAPMREQLWLVVILIGALLLGTGACVGLVWRQQSIRFYRERAETDNRTRRFATVVKDSNDAITIQDFEGRITAWNRGAELMYGYSEAEALAVNIERLTTPDKVAEQEDFIRRLIAGEAITSFETQRVTKDGRVLDVWMTVTKLMDDAGNPIGLASTERDITARKQAEEKLKGIETLLQTAVDAMPVGLWILDAEGKIVTSSTAAQRIWTGVHYVGVDQLGEYKGWRIDSGKLIEPHEWAGARALEKGETSIEEEVEIECFDGTHKIILDSAVPLRKSDGSIGGAITINQDITERRRAEKDLRRFATVVKDSNDAITIQDFEGRITAWNRGAELMYGYSEAEALAVNIERLTSPGKVAEQKDFIRRLVAGEAVNSFETQRVTKDGRVLDVWMTVTKLMDDAGNPIGLASTERDITARKQAEVALHQSGLTLQEKNAELERFLYTASHDLKSPVVTVRTFLGYLEQDMAKADAVRIEKDLRFIRTAADKMARLLDELLQISRIGRVVCPPVRVTLRTLVDETLSTVAGRIAERGVKVIVGEQDVTLYGDQLRLAEIWQNLVENACKFMGDQKEPRIDLGVEVREAEMVFFVRDNGIGIDPHYHAKVFSLFEKLDSKAEGTGLGLAIVKRIVELYRGKLWVESPGQGQGACFYFTLPGAEDRSQET
ncbi:MAG: hypothetical protein A3K19_12105 [Lentisphaerae bacterium RIFOXYB12_FULL_65_16]|nr:MAG: hypothetical protein A3K18_14500 [Lentisphaerae bacterium RIFOXYA12_64_32]OGV86220.1 MAG: hypothetical protein A3K19_12105 [Lentisphaerae bacterium RIFOXYB12_FULL_65_16]